MIWKRGRPPADGPVGAVLRWSSSFCLLPSGKSRRRLSISSASTWPKHAHCGSVRDGKSHTVPQTFGDIILMPAGQPSYWRWERLASVLHLQIDPELLRTTVLTTGAATPITRLELINNFGQRDPLLTHLALALRAGSNIGRPERSHLRAKPDHRAQRASLAAILRHFDASADAGKQPLARAAQAYRRVRAREPRHGPQPDRSRRARQFKPVPLRALVQASHRRDFSPLRHRATHRSGPKHAR